MARATVVPVTPTVDGTALPFTAPTVDGDAVLPGTVLVVDNASAGVVNVTLVTGGEVEGLAVADKVVAVPAATIEAIAVPLAPVYRQQGGTTHGMVHVDYDVVASVTRASLRSV